MTGLFNRGELRDYFAKRLQSGLPSLESMPEDAVLSRSTGDIVSDLTEAAQVEHLVHLISATADLDEGWVVFLALLRELWRHSSGYRALTPR